MLLLAALMLGAIKKFAAKVAVYLPTIRKIALQAASLIHMVTVTGTSLSLCMAPVQNWPMILVHALLIFGATHEVASLFRE